MLHPDLRIMYKSIVINHPIGALLVSYDNLSRRLIIILYLWHVGSWDKL